MPVNETEKLKEYGQGKSKGVNIGCVGGEKMRIRHPR